MDLPGFEEFLASDEFAAVTSAPPEYRIFNFPENKESFETFLSTFYVDILQKSVTLTCQILEAYHAWLQAHL